MKLLIDACVLVPAVPRGMVLGAAEAGAFRPLWSPRILEEWARAARRSDDEAGARAAAAAMRVRWPEAEVRVAPEAEAGLALPDPGDLHVLAAALAGGAEAILTLNARDFPSRTLGRHGLYRRDPDGLLSELAAGGLDLRSIGEALRARIAGEAGSAPALLPMLRRAGMPRLARLLTTERAR